MFILLYLQMQEKKRKEFIFGIGKLLILNEIRNFLKKNIKEIKKTFIKEIYKSIYRNIYFKYVLIYELCMK